MYLIIKYNIIPKLILTYKFNITLLHVINNNYN